MTDNQETDSYRPTLGETSHTNPFTGKAFGETQTYDRGKTVVADGGEADDKPAEPRVTETVQLLRDINHTPPEGAESANAVHARGGEASPSGEQAMPEANE
jgi:hypothetical protein